MNDEVTTIDLSLDAVEAWLRSKPPEAEVGDAGSMSYCPLATYANEMSGLDACASDSKIGLYLHDRGEWHYVPTNDEQKRFIIAVDELGAEHGVTAAEALAIIERVRREVLTCPR